MSPKEEVAEAASCIGAFLTATFTDSATLANDGTLAVALCSDTVACIHGCVFSASCCNLSIPYLLITRNIRALYIRNESHGCQYADSILTGVVVALTSTELDVALSRRRAQFTPMTKRRAWDATRAAVTAARRLGGLPASLRGGIVDETPKPSRPKTIPFPVEENAPLTGRAGRDAPSPSLSRARRGALVCCELSVLPATVLLPSNPNVSVQLPIHGHERSAHPKPPQEDVMTLLRNPLLVTPAPAAPDAGRRRPATMIPPPAAPAKRHKITGRPRDVLDTLCQQQ